MQLETIRIFNYSVTIAPAPRLAATERITKSLQGERTLAFFLNPHTIEVAANDEELRTSIEIASNLYCDGIGLSIAIALVKKKIVKRVIGYDFFISTSDVAFEAIQDLKVLFIGGSKEVCSKIERRYKYAYPQVTVDFIIPDVQDRFSESTLDAWAKHATDFNPHIIWVGLGSPKQEKVCAELFRRTSSPFIGAIGAVFDFYSELESEKTRKFFQRLGIQWLQRLILEPKRLWRRTFFSGTKFIIRTVLEIMRPIDK